ncbi:hypothetical protein OGATHE_004360 [Ogataea polymorpha]|uniref:Golgin subfamily A member 7/ERF4 domain-containing protein n=1 Tax=Ogataea polymorpha TaxID=460523 RepID=A0A9P8P0F7_9ASCO|nr:hypothetical protein OGATHE_004360 [Ogataea polymorpha]
MDLQISSGISNSRICEILAHASGDRLYVVWGAWCVVSVDSGLAFTMAFNFNVPSVAYFSRRSSSCTVFVLSINVRWSGELPIVFASSSLTLIARVATVDHPNFKLDQYNRFEPKVLVDDQWFGTDLGTPLALYLEQEEVEQVIANVNKLLENQYSWKWGPYLLLDTLTFGILSRLRWDKTYADKLEIYIRDVNADLKKRGIPVEFVSPRRSGYLSLDVLVPRPNGPV